MEFYFWTRCGVCMLITNPASSQIGYKCDGSYGSVLVSSKITNATQACTEQGVMAQNAWMG